MRNYLTFLFLILPALAASSTGPNHHGAAAEETMTAVYSWSKNGTWVENFVLRPDGTLLVTRLDVPEIWTIDPTSNHGSMVHKFSHITSCFGITDLGNDDYAVVVGNFSTTTNIPVSGSFEVWSVAFSGNKSSKKKSAKKGSESGKTDSDDAVAAPAVSKIQGIPEATALNGITTFDQENGVVLVADSPAGRVWKLDIKTKAYSIVLSDETMLPDPNQHEPLGVNGIHVLHDYIYYSSTTKEQLGRVKVDANATAVGPYEIIAGGFVPDNFAVAQDGTAYVATNIQNSVLKISPTGRVTLFAGSQFQTTIPGATSVVLDEKAGIAYVGTCGGQIAPVLGTYVEPAKIVSFKM